MILLVFGAVGVILWIGGHDVLAGRISAGDLSAFVFYAVSWRARSARSARSIGDLQRAAGATERLIELLETEPQIARRPSRWRCRRRRAARSGSSDVHLPLSVAPRTRRARRSRSTSARARRWRWSARRAPARRRCSSCCCASTIRSEGVITHRRGRDRRRRPGRRTGADRAVVPQDPVIFAASVLENIRYGRPGRERRRSARRLRRRLRDRVHRAAAGGLRDASSASAACACPAGSGSGSAIARAILADRAGAAARRGDQRARRRERARGAAGAGAS